MRIRDETARKNFIDAFVFDCLDVDLPMVAYGNVPEPMQAFPQIASHLLSQVKLDELSDFIAAHRKRFPNDLWADYYQGECQIDKQVWEAAAASLETAWRKATVEDKKRIQYSYYYAMVQAGKYSVPITRPPTAITRFLKLVENWCWPKNGSSSIS